MARERDEFLGDPEAAAAREWRQGFTQKPGTGARVSAGNRALALSDEERQRKARAALLAFYWEMLKVFDPNDPRYSRILDTIRAKVSTESLNRGIEGGLSKTAIARQLSDAALAIDQARQQMGLQALGMELADANQAIAYRDAMRQRAAEIAYRNAMAQYQHGAGQAQMLGSTLGAGLGALIGSPLGPAGMLAGAAFGGQIGGGLAGGFYGPPPPYPGYGYGYGGGDFGGPGGRGGY